MEATVNIRFEEPDYEDVDLTADEEGDIFIEQGGDVILIPLSEADAFADAIKAWAAGQGALQN